MNETVKAGKYYLGDPVEALPEKYSIGIWGNEYGYRSGKINISGFDMVVHNTHNGDGIYKDTRERTYKVTSGTIGLVPIELLPYEINNLHGHLYEFNEKVNFIYDAGVFYIKSGNKYISIDTRDMNEYDSDHEVHYENENGEPITKTIAGDSDDDMIDECDNGEYDTDNDDSNELFEPKPRHKNLFFKNK